MGIPLESITSFIQELYSKRKSLTNDEEHIQLLEDFVSKFKYQFGKLENQFDVLSDQFFALQKSASNIPKLTINKSTDL